MHVQNIFEETRTEILHALMRDYPLASVVTMTEEGMDANNIPFELDSSAGALGTLRCHVGRSNPIWQSFRNDPQILTIFQGPNAYISPRWYINGQKSRRVFPSWNYAVVHAYGVMQVIDDRAWLLEHLSRLASHNEKSLPSPWQLQEASPEFAEQAVANIIGLEISITKLVGKWQVSQQRTAADRESVSNALLARPNDVSAATAELIRRVDHHL
ncbi:MAG: hypothetical protein A3I66_09875 [Burkholderiales bacterium RIFCSPLOWO2_02_FULL_57_36]|nr:MAG: hypothetical protein A3I66_09875 [Burkholderiales bacterium RIFCSPLOWO2_02_FULL_57_36]